jgi:hypothetical protein
MVTSETSQADVLLEGSRPSEHNSHIGDTSSRRPEMFTVGRKPPEQTFTYGGTF